MNIFLSYPSDERAMGERVHYALVAQGHDVFFDREDLKAGHEYDMAIARAIDESDLVVFLITPGSVTAGRYTLTELKLVQRKWPHASGRVLPVMLRPTDINAVPAYLRAVNFLTPHGDVGAEIAHEVRNLARSHSLPSRVARGARTPTGVVVIAAVLTAAALWGAAATDRWPFTPSAASPDSTGAITDRSPLAPSAALPDKAGTMTDRAAPLPDGIRQRARAVAPAGKSDFVVAVAGPAQLHRFSARGEAVGAPLSLAGEPVSSVTGPGQIMLITRAPDGVTILDGNDLRVIATVLLDPRNVVKPPELAKVPRLSGDIQSATALNGMLWVVTGERDGEPAILRFRTPERQWEIPSWSAHPEGVVGGGARGLRLRPFPDGLWAVNTTKSPSSLYHLMGFVRIDEFGGHDIPMVSCARDLARGSAGNLLFLSCDNELLEVRAEGRDLRLLRARPTLPRDSTSGNWTDEIIVPDSTVTIVALNTHGNKPANRPGRARIVEVDSAGAMQTLLDRADAVVHSMAVTPAAVIVVLRLANNQFDALRITREPR